MVNEMAWIIDWIDASGGVRENTNKITEQDVKRAQWDSAKAKKVQEEIKKDKSKNDNIAKFLEFLLKNIKNEDLISAIYNTFFKVVDPRTKTSYLRKTINNILVVGFFAPFFKEELSKYNLKWYFDEILGNFNWIPSFEEYVNYVKRLSKKYHDQIPINQTNLLNLLALILSEFEVSKDMLNQSWLDKIKKELSKK